MFIRYVVNSIANTHNIIISINNMILHYISEPMRYIKYIESSGIRLECYLNDIYSLQQPNIHIHPMIDIYKVNEVAFYKDSVEIESIQYLYKRKYKSQFTFEFAELTIEFAELTIELLTNSINLLKANLHLNVDQIHTY